jgi:hypothetical protein
MSTFCSSFNGGATGLFLKRTIGASLNTSCREVGNAAIFTVVSPSSWANMPILSGNKIYFIKFYLF